LIARLDFASLVFRLIGVFLGDLRASPPTSPRTRRTPIRTSFDNRGFDLAVARATAMAPISAAMIARARWRLSAPDRCLPRNTAASVIHLIDMSRWDDEPVPQQEWTVTDRTPASAPAAA
jgi:hypothetical protein